LTHSLKTSVSCCSCQGELCCAFCSSWTNAASPALQ
jgi:hypothetical protein